MGSTYSLAVAAVVVTLRAGVVMGVAVDTNDCTKQLPRCMANQGNCDHCTHVQSKNRMIYEQRGMVLPLCLTYDKWSMMWENYGRTGANCFSPDFVYCSSSKGDPCYAYAATGKKAVTGADSGKWKIQLRNQNDQPLNQWVSGTISIGFTEIRTGQGLYGELLRGLATTRGFTVAVNTECADCPSHCTFEPTLSVYAVFPDPHENKFYTGGKNGPQSFYDTVAPATAAASDLFVVLNEEESLCVAAQVPAIEHTAKWKNTWYTLTLLPMLGDNQHTCSEWNGKGLCKPGQYLTLDSTRCVGQAHCRQKCCSCGGDNLYYANWCPYYVQQGYCKHTWVDWMKSNCGGSCCKAASG